MQPHGDGTHSCAKNERERVGHPAENLVRLRALKSYPNVAKKRDVRMGHPATCYGRDNWITAFPTKFSPTPQF
jgi:hypothetical protein